MNIQEFAQMLNGRQMGQEMTPEEAQQARELGFVIVFGYSDDIAEFHGAIYDDAGCYEGAEIFLDKDGLFKDCEHDHFGECKYIKTAKSLCKKIEAVWDAEGYSWIYKTDIPHATFDILEEGEKYCRGIVFELKALGMDKA